jgi:hypothetical protein
LHLLWARTVPVHLRQIQTPFPIRFGRYSRYYSSIINFSACYSSLVRKCVTISNTILRTSALILLEVFNTWRIFLRFFAFCPASFSSCRTTSRELKITLFGVATPEELLDCWNRKTRREEKIWTDRQNCDDVTMFNPRVQAPTHSSPSTNLNPPAAATTTTLFHANGIDIGKVLFILYC